MNRIFGILLASTLAIGMASRVSAQEYVFPGAVVDGPLQGGGFVNGGFGNIYVQMPPISGIAGNRWNMLGGEENPIGIPYGDQYVQPGTIPAQPEAAFTQPRTVVAQPRTFLGRRRTVARGNDGAPAPYGTPLPQTRLYGQGGVMAPYGYAPNRRRQTYGAGYGLGPYGSNYYSEYWHGQPIYPIYP